MTATGSKKKAPTERDSLAKTVSKNKKIKKHVAKSADRLTLVNRTLKQGHKTIIPLTTMKKALVQNEGVERQVTKAADDLHLVNIDLVKEVVKREKAESELADTKTSLTKVRADLSESKAKEEETREFALKDKLTKLPNRAYFEQALDKRLSQAKRHNFRIAVLFIDVDNFKHFNDQYGHDLGDKILLMVANRLQANVRNEDMVSRWGGDEFVCMLVEVEQAAAVTLLAEKMVQCIAEDCELEGIIHCIEVSIGIAIYPADGETVDILFKNADKAMYKAKRAKNRVAVL